MADIVLTRGAERTGETPTYQVMLTSDSIGRGFRSATQAIALYTTYLGEGHTLCENPKLITLFGNQQELLHLFQQKADEEEVIRIIQQMTQEQFQQFQTELQYAVKWWSIAYEAAKRYALWNDPDQQKHKRAHDFLLDGKKCAFAIIQSPLYDAVRERVRTLFPDQEVAADWAGWIGLSTKQDVDAINNALEAILHYELPTGFISLLGIETTDDQFAAAKATIARYGIQGMFVEDPTVEHLVATFLSHYRVAID